MNFRIDRIPTAITLLAILLMLLHGPIRQPADYHHFAAQSAWLGIPHVADVLSNIGFALVGICGWVVLARRRAHPALAAGWAGYRLFLVGLALTAAGSAYYHWLPDNGPLVWDRLPIALACAGLLAAVRAETRGHGASDPRDTAAVLALGAVVSVAWWVFTERAGAGDLRPYLLLQGLPLVLIPLWQAIHGAPRADRIYFGAALLLYVAAKFAELNDHQILAAWSWISGHTLKHVLATAAAALLVHRLAERTAVSVSDARSRVLSFQ